MACGYKIQSVDIDEVFESFPLDIAATYDVADSKLSDDTGKFKNNGQLLKIASNKTFPTSAGNYLGGANSLDKIKVEGQPIDIALKGCRPIGIPVARVLEGTHYINRINGQTWLSSTPNSATGIRLEYDPKFLHAEVLGGGGGGAGSASLYASAGGGGGGYCYVTLSLPENSYIQLIVGAKGYGGNARENGASGGISKILRSDGSEICSASGGNGGAINNGDGGWYGSATGGIVNISGGQGGSKERNGQSVPQTSVVLSKPEQTVWNRGGTNGGYSNGNNFGGGGGASAFSNGADGNSNTTPAAAGYGAGGAGAGFKALSASAGGDGGDGLINLYY